MASRKRERVGVVTEVDSDSATVALGPAVHSDSGGPADFGAALEAATGAGAEVRVSFDGNAYQFDPPTPIDFSRRFDPPLNPALANDPGGWCVYAPDWIGGRPVLARDASGRPLSGLTEAEARLVVRVLGRDYTAARES